MLTAFWKNLYRGGYIVGCLYVSEGDTLQLYLYNNLELLGLITFIYKKYIQ